MTDRPTCGSEIDPPLSVADLITDGLAMIIA